MAAKAFYFCRDKSNKNTFFFLGFFATQGFCAANQSEPRAANSCPTAFTHYPMLLQIFAMPPATAQGHQVLPDFIRSELQLSESEFIEF
jgi:hypothetical protein